MFHANIIYFRPILFEVRGRIFFSSDNFQGTFVDSRFMIFTKAFMNELACTLIHVRKIFNCRMLFRNC